MESPLAETFLSAEVWPLHTLFSMRRLVPAPIQRGFEWGEVEAWALLRTLDQAFSEFQVTPAVAAEGSEADSEDDARDNTEDDTGPQIERLADSETVPIPPSSPLGVLFLGSMVLMRSEKGQIEIYGKRSMICF